MAFQGYLKEDTATTCKLGPFTDITDGVTYEVGMAAAMNHADTGVRISKNGGALAARTTATEPVYDAFGYYLVNLDATDVGTVGRLKVIFGAPATCLPCEADFEILPANVFDSLMGTDLLDTHVTEFTNDAITAASINTGAFTADAFAADAIIAATLATGCLTADAFAADAIVAATLATGAITADAFAANALVAATFAADSLVAGTFATGCLTADAFAADAIVAATLATGAITADAFAANAIVAATLAANCITATQIADASIDAATFAAGAINAAAIADAAIDAATFAAGAIDAAAIAAGAIDNATFAADVGSTAYATNIIALAVDKALVNENLDHLAKTATAAVDMTAEVVDGSIISRIISNSDTSLYVPATSNLTTAMADSTAVHAHVATIDGHITADYGATEKTCIDLLDDAVAGLVDIHTDVGTAVADIAAVHVHAQTIIDDVAAVHVHAGLIQTDTNAILVDTAVIGPATGASITADIAAVKAETATIVADTAELQTDWVNGGRLDLLLDAAIADIAATHVHASAAYDEAVLVHAHAATIEADVAAVHVHAATIEADTNELQTDWVNGGRLDLILDTAAGASPTAAQVADAVWDEVRADHVIVGTFGEVTAAADLVDDIWDEAYAGHVGAGTTGLAVATPTAATITAAVWGEALPGAYGVGTAGAYLAAAGVGADPWATDLPGAYGGITAGHIIGHLGAPVGATLSADIAAVKTQLDDVHTDVGTVTADVAAVHVHAQNIETDTAAVHVHVGTIDGHITADYTATEKAAIDLLDDAVGGLLDVHTDLGTVTTDVAAIHVHVGTIDGHISVDYGATEKAAIDLLDDAVGGLLDIHTDVGTVTADVAAVHVHAATIEADTNELQTDWVNGGRLDLLLDGAAAAGDPWITPIPGAYAAGTAGFILGNNVNAPIATVDTVVDNIYARLGAPAGASVSADIAAMKVDTAAILVDTGTTLDANITAILADTNELQTDWVNGGRLDLLLDAASAPSAAAVATAVWGSTIETGFTATQVQRIMFAVLSGASADHALGIPKFYAVDGVTVRAQANVDADGNRTLISRSGA